MIHFARFIRTRVEGAKACEVTRRASAQSLTGANGSLVPMNPGEFTGNSREDARRLPETTWFHALYAYADNGSNDYDRDDEDFAVTDEDYLVVQNHIDDFSKWIAELTPSVLRKDLKLATPPVDVEDESWRKKQRWRTWDLSRKMRLPIRSYWRLIGQLWGAWEPGWEKWEIIPEDGLGTAAGKDTAYWIWFTQDEEERARRWGVFLQWDDPLVLANTDISCDRS